MELGTGSSRVEAHASFLDLQAADEGFSDRHKRLAAEAQIAALLAIEDRLGEIAQQLANR
jgi:hypothetical protein